MLEWGQGKGDDRTEGGTVGHKAMSISNLLLFTDFKEPTHCWQTIYRSTSKLRFLPY